MGTKHTVMTEEDMVDVRLDKNVEDIITGYLLSNSSLKPGMINVLDWGCGRGKSVLLLKEKGFNAFGVEIDDKTLKNGYPIFRARGLTPEDIIFDVEKLSMYPDGYFHIIFSEQVLEHVADFNKFTYEIGRLTKPFGMGIHIFPGSKWIHEPHIKIPFVHWLPKNIIRKIIILLFLMFVPKYLPSNNTWPEAEGKTIWGISDLFFKYLNNKTHYRDIEKIVDQFKRKGFEVQYQVVNYMEKKIIPKLFSRNGFPDKQIILYIKINDQRKDYYVR